MAKIFRPNTTYVPNFIFDSLMRNISDIELRTLLCLIRKIYGWHKEADRISQSQIIEMTGLSKNAVKKAIKSLRKQKFIQIVSKGNGHKITKYRIFLNDLEDHPMTLRGAIEIPLEDHPMTPQNSITKETNKILMSSNEFSDNPQKHLTILESKQDILIIEEPKKRKIALKEKKGNENYKLTQREVTDFFTQKLNGHAAKIIWSEQVRAVAKLRELDLPTLTEHFKNASQDDFWGSSVLTPRRLLSAINGGVREKTRYEKKKAGLIS